MHFEITIDELTKEVWRFWLYGNVFYLDYYSLQKKHSKRHRKYESIKTYDRLSNRSSNISEHEVPLTDDIKQLLFDKFMKSLSVKLWSER